MATEIRTPIRTNWPRSERHEVIARLGTILCVGLVAVGCSRAARPLGLICEKVTNMRVSYSCSLDEGASFRGASLGMAQAYIFHQLLKPGEVLAWAARSADRSKFSPLKVGMEEGDWHVLSGSNEWLLRGNGDPCVGYRYSVMRFHDRRLSHLAVYCSD